MANEGGPGDNKGYIRRGHKKFIGKVVQRSSWRLALHIDCQNKQSAN